ncbi:unnamed protein product [marine sediment metagenome]|uniref:Uncharacterized protein n=1 Tax=marine sediment metagenome TaxID=412755 RepID=X0Y3Y6_9ZZZZ
MDKPHKCPHKFNGGPSVHQHDDGRWWWYDEVWSHETGPFEKKENATASLVRYCKEELDWDVHAQEN